MKKVVLTFGLISGLVILAPWLAHRWPCMTDRIELDGQSGIGYASMLIALSMVFFGIKSYRDNYAGGKISFWKGVQIGLLISLISAFLYWGGSFAFSVANPGFQAKFIQKYTDQTVVKMHEHGAPQEEIDKATADIALMEKLFQNPLLFFLVCVVEFLPIGIIVTLISGITAKKEICRWSPA
jgi:hypothetical protein